MEKASKITLQVMMTDEWRKAIAWNINDSKPMTDEQIFTYLVGIIEKDRDELLHGRYGYREAMDRRNRY